MRRVRFLTIAAILLWSTLVLADLGDDAAEKLWRACPNLIFSTWQRHVDEGARYILGLEFIDLMYGVDTAEIGAAKIALLYRKAAEQGYAFAQFSLGVMHVKGTGVPQDLAEAARWYHMAARRGHGLAQYNLGVMYATGIGVHQDHVRSYAWLSTGFAVHGGRRYAARVKECVAKAMTQTDIADAQDLSHSYWNDYVMPFFSMYRTLCQEFENDSVCQ